MLRALLAPYEADARECGDRKVLKLSLEEAEEVIGVAYVEDLLRLWGLVGAAEAESDQLRARIRELESESAREDLREQAGELCTWCWWRLPCAKDPEKGWVHVDPDEYRARGMDALHVCLAPDLSEQIARTRGRAS